MLNVEDFMRKGLFLGVIGFVAIVTITSCTSFQVGGLEVHQTRTEGTIVGELNIKVGIHKVLGDSGGINLFNASSDVTDPLITQAIRTEIQNQGGTSAVNVKIVYKATFLNMLLNGLTCSIYAPATAYITGTIIK
jgi:hypothetical protein